MQLLYCTAVLPRKQGKGVHKGFRLLGLGAEASGRKAKRPPTLSRILTHPKRSVLKCCQLASGVMFENGQADRTCLKPQTLASLKP